MKSHLARATTMMVRASQALFGVSGRFGVEGSGLGIQGLGFGA